MVKFFFIMTLKVTEVLQVLSDTTRLRMLRLLHQDELSVAELQEILEMGQSESLVIFLYLEDSISSQIEKKVKRHITHLR